MMNWLEPFLRDADMTQEALADALNVSRATVNRLAQDHSKLKRSRAVEIAALLNVDPDRLMVGQPRHAKLETKSFKPEINNRFTQVPDLDIFGGLGGGGALSVQLNNQGDIMDGDQVRGIWQFPEYITRGVPNMKKVYAHEVRGDSMEPTLLGGSVVFVDTGQNITVSDDIFAIDYGDGLMVKRLQPVPKSEFISVISDNPVYENHRLSRDDIHVFGRVIGWFQWRG